MRLLTTAVCFVNTVIYILDFPVYNYIQSLLLILLAASLEHDR